MYLRKLKPSDAPLMLEWMHDEDVIGKLRTNFMEKTLDDCNAFIAASDANPRHLHMAIAADDDEYMGTVSLRDIQGGCAEFAITVRKKAMGEGYSWYGMRAILDKAFTELGLEKVYWCVSSHNVRAVRFYDKHEFLKTDDVPDNYLKEYEGVPDLIWYVCYE